MNKPEFILHRAPWVVPIISPPIADGAVLVHGDKVLSVGPYRLIRKQKPVDAQCIEHHSAALMPALVNAHTHLELSAMGGLIRLPQESFRHWIRELFAQRLCLGRDDVEKGAIEAERQLHRSGVVLCGDISNGSFLQVTTKGGCLHKHIFLEVLGFNQDSVDGALDPENRRAFHAAAMDNAALSLSAHACYSASAAIIQQAKAWCRDRERVFSIHVSEHDEEIRFLQDGTGFCRELLEGLGKWVPGWSPPFKSPVQYLEELGVLDGKTMLVHCVYMTDSDWETIRKHGCSVCFCPRSNANINAGRADVSKALKAGIPAALGTDSLASNTDLNLFSEGTLLLEEFPSLNPRDILSMMTLGGARALGYDHQFGTIGTGMRLPLLAVDLPSAISSPQLLEQIFYRGKEGAIQWVN